MDLETPCVLVEADRLERNIARAAGWARARGARLRPHAKTHKVVEVARLQLQAGASGLSVAKGSEAEVFADAGCDDLFVAFPVVGPDKARRLLALAERVRLAVGVDSLEGARSLAAPFAEAGRVLDVLLKVDVGLHRVGVEPEEAPPLALRLAETKGVRLRGLFTHAGQAYHQPTPDEVARVGLHEGGTLVATAAAVRALGIAVEEVSVGSTPTARHALGVEGVTECRPGNYVYHDGSQLGLGTCSPDDCALTVLATVVSVPAHGRAVLDAGSKTLSSDPLRPRPDGFGLVLGSESRVARLSEEHGVIDVAEGDVFRVGQKVRVLPNHACVVSNLHDHVWVVRGEEVVGRWAVAARGRVL